MTENHFRVLVALIALIFCAVFAVVVIPPLLENPDILGAFAAGFVNPFAAGYSTDVILCWVVMAIWVVYERVNLAVKHGWICLVLGVVPGVVVGFALYLIVRSYQLTALSKS